MNENELKSIKFEDAIARLENIVSSLEGGKCELDESLELFEEGVALVKLCTSKLDGAAAKVKILTAKGEEDFAPSEDGKQND